MNDILKDLKIIAEKLTRKQWLELTENIERLRNNIDALESEVASLKMTLGIVQEGATHFENENMMLKTKLTMYEELVKVKDTIIKSIYNIGNRQDLIIKEQELEEQIKSLDKKCDGACEI